MNGILEFFSVKCPYCGFNQRKQLESDTYTTRSVEICAIEEGGCDKYFVVAIKLIPEVKTFKIEGTQ